MSKKRNPALSLLNVLFCLLVLFIHCISYPVSHYAPGTLAHSLVVVFWRLSSFVVPGFILLSGVKLFLTGKDSLSYPKYLLGRVRGVILPYALAFCLYFLLFWWKGTYPLQAGFLLKNFVLGSLVYHLYFIPILFQFDLLFPLWKRTIPTKSPLLLLPFALAVTLLCESHLSSLFTAAFPGHSLLYNDRLFTSYLFYWLAGCYIGKNYESFTLLLRENFFLICGFFCTFLFLNGYFSILAWGAFRSVPSMNSIHSLYVVSTLLFLFALAEKLPAERLSASKVLKRLDGATFHIYLYHVFVLYAADFLLSKIALSQVLCFFLRMGAVLAFAFILAYLPKKKKQK